MTYLGEMYVPYFFPKWLCWPSYVEVRQYGLHSYWLMHEGQYKIVAIIDNFLKLIFFALYPTTIVCW